MLSLPASSRVRGQYGLVASLAASLIFCWPQAALLRENLTAATVTAGFCSVVLFSVGVYLVDSRKLKQFSDENRRFYFSSILISCFCLFCPLLALQFLVPRSAHLVLVNSLLLYLLWYASFRLLFSKT